MKLTLIAQIKKASPGVLKSFQTDQRFQVEKDILVFSSGEEKYSRARVKSYPEVNIFIREGFGEEIKIVQNTLDGSILECQIRLLIAELANQINQDDLNKISELKENMVSLAKYLNKLRTGSAEDVDIDAEKYPIREFFGLKDPRFNLSADPYLEPEDCEEITAYRWPGFAPLLCYDGVRLIFRMPQLRPGGHGFGLLESELMDLIKELVDKVNGGDYSKLQELADTTYSFVERWESKLHSKLSSNIKTPIEFFNSDPRFRVECEDENQYAIYVVGDPNQFCFLVLDFGELALIKSACGMYNFTLLEYASWEFVEELVGKVERGDYSVLPEAATQYLAFIDLLNKRWLVPPLEDKNEKA